MKSRTSIPMQFPVVCLYLEIVFGRSPRTEDGVERAGKSIVLSIVGQMVTAQQIRPGPVRSGLRCMRVWSESSRYGD